MKSTKPTFQHFKIGDFVKPKDKEKFQLGVDLRGLIKLKVVSTSGQNTSPGSSHVTVTVIEDSTNNSNYSTYKKGSTFGVYNVDIELFEEEVQDYEIF